MAILTARWMSRRISRYVATFLASHGAARNFDVTCELVAGNGNLDFWVVGPVASAGLAKIAIEAKKAENANLERSFTTQLPEYMGLNVPRSPARASVCLRASACGGYTA